jgi:hypothetical protein
MDRPSIPPNAAAPRRSGLDGVLRHWQTARRGRAVPARTDINPAVLLPWLPLAGIVERARDGRVRFRLGGSGLGTVLGVEARGVPLRSLFAVEARPRLCALIDEMFDRPAALILSGALPGAGTAPPLAAEMALLPLSDASGAVTRALFCLVPDDATVALRAGRFHLTDTQLIALTPAPATAPARGAAPVLQVIRGGRDRAPA